MTRGKLRMVVLAMLAGFCMAAGKTKPSPTPNPYPYTYTYPYSYANPYAPYGNQPDTPTPPAKQQPAAPAPAAPATQPASPLAGDMAAETAAQSTFDFAKKTLDDLITKLLADSQKGSKDWADGQAKLTQAQANLVTANKGLDIILASDVDYQQALAARQKAADDLAAAKNADEPTDVIATLAEASMQAAVNLEKLHKEIAGGDADLVSADAQVAAAQQALAALIEQFQQTLPANADYVAAKAALDAAYKAWTDAHAKLLADGG